MLEHAVVAEGGGEGATRQEAGGRREGGGGEPTLITKQGAEGGTNRVESGRGPKETERLFIVVGSNNSVSLGCLICLQVKSM